MNMAQSAKLGALAIKYVELSEMSKSVGGWRQKWYGTDMGYS
jgi:hypothetical protein